ERKAGNNWLQQYSGGGNNYGLIKAGWLNLTFDTSGLTNADVQNVTMTFGHVNHVFNYFVFENQTPDIVNNNGLIYYKDAASHPYSGPSSWINPDAARLGGHQSGGIPSVTWNTLTDIDELNENKSHLNVYGHGTIAYGNFSFEVVQSSSVVQTASVVPVPATLWLFGTVFLGLATYRKKYTLFNSNMKNMNLT
ncbi:MAG: PEP-CTERM sorting domain-containing protein, partial [Alteromonadales bacterium]|nr:PEP-CTERM sorting domain-containing protein [Alteromonadales bacterium]